MTTDFRALCVELTDCLEKADWPLRYRYVFRQWVDIARAALADEPAVPDGRKPTRDELWELWMRLNNELPDRPAAVAEFWQHAQVDARFRWGNPAPQPPADGEVAELVAKLRRLAPHNPLGTADPTITRAADLLQHLSPPQPVLVSERLPGPEDCDAEGRCWWWYPEVPGKTYGYWAHEDDAVPERAFNEQPLHWLPAHALPLPEVES